MSTLFLRNIEQVALFKMELSGQISDGHWENSRPHDHWQVWCRAKVVVAPKGTAPGRNFWAKRDRYGLTSSMLLSIVGGRMLGQVRLAQQFGLAGAEELESCLGCGEEGAFTPTFDDPAKYAADGNEYWAEKVWRLKKFDLKVAETHALHGNYGKRELLKDLREIAEAMRTWSDAKDLPEEPEAKEKPRFFGHRGLANAVATLTGLKVEACDPPATPRNAWYELKTSTGMVVTNFQTQPGSDGGWVVMGKSLPFPDSEMWEKVQRLGA
jgi:hypothetical protein